MHQRVNVHFFKPTGTTRPPRSGEEPGIDYIFISREKFLEMEKKGNFLETGSYNGHYYGTPKPLLGSLIVREQPSEISAVENENVLLETDKTEDNNTENNELVTVHHDSENLSENMEDKKDNDLEKERTDRKNNNLRRHESWNDQPINV